MDIWKNSKGPVITLGLNLISLSIHGDWTTPSSVDTYGVPNSLYVYSFLSAAEKQIMGLQLVCLKEAYDIICSVQAIYNSLFFHHRFALCYPVTKTMIA